MVYVHVCMYFHAVTVGVLLPVIVLVLVVYIVITLLIICTWHKRLHVSYNYCTSHVKLPREIRKIFAAKIHFRKFVNSRNRGEILLSIS